MEFEVLKRSHLKRNIIIGVIVVLIISAIILNFTKAKYRSVATTPLIHSEINYTLPDLNIIGLYVNGEEVQELDSTKNYVLDTSKSTCTYKDGSTIDNLTITYDSNTKGLSITPYTTKGTKCTLYFDEQKILLKDAILANATTQLTRSSFSSTVTNTTTGTIYYADTKDGRTYYFAGRPTDNWVKFAGFYWRIIRINEDGSIRMIYNGTSNNTTGTGTQIQTSTFSISSSTSNNNAYVGYMYTLNQVHGLGTDSGIKKVLDEWYEKNLQKNYANYLSTEAGFCGDREPSTSESTSNGNGGTGTTYTCYGAYIRLITNKAPTFECQNDSDLYTVGSASGGNKALDYPIGLITADEVAYAGGVYGSNNTSYYLYTGQYYWTMSPYNTNSSGTARVFNVNSNGSLDWHGVDNAYGVRPVINLKADVQFTGEGTVNSPFEVIGA